MTIVSDTHSITRSNCVNNSRLILLSSVIDIVLNIKPSGTSKRPVFFLTVSVKLRWLWQSNNDISV